MPRFAPTATLAALCLVLSPTTSRAADEAKVLRIRAERLAASGDCTSALVLLEQALEMQPGDGDASRLAADCWIRGKRFAEARDALEAAKRSAPGTRGLDLLLGIARFHSQDLEGAADALHVARADGETSPLLDFYEGLLLLQRGESDGAAEKIAIAREAGAPGMEPLASYYEGLALAGAEDRRGARAAFRRARSIGGDTEWGEEAQRRLDDLSPFRAGSWWVEATVGVEIDDNVVLRGDGVRLPSEISDEDDARFAWRAKIGRELFRNETWSGGAMLSYSGSAHRDFSEFNVHFPIGSIWVDRRLGESLVAHLQYDAGYAWVDTESFLVPHAVTPALYYDWENGQRSALYSRFFWYDYRYRRSADVPDGPGVVGGPCLSPSDLVCAPPGIDEYRERNRDGHGHAITFEHGIPVERLRTSLTAGATLHRYSARGNEYSYRGYEASLRTRSALPWAVMLDLGASYTYRPYDDPSTYPDPTGLVANRQYALDHDERSDDIWRFDVGVERAVTKTVIASLRYSFVNNRSNVRVFDYDRTVLGAYLTVRLP